MEVKINDDFGLSYNNHSDEVELNSDIGGTIACFAALNKDEVKNTIAFLSECLTGGNLISPKPLKEAKDSVLQKMSDALPKGVARKNIMHCYKDGNAWCAIYPMGSNLMDCEAVAFVDEDIRFNEHLGGERDYGPRKALAKLREELIRTRNDNHSVSTSYYCEAWV